MNYGKFSSYKNKLLSTSCQSLAFPFVLWACWDIGLCQTQAEAIYLFYLNNQSDHLMFGLSVSTKLISQFFISPPGVELLRIRIPGSRFTTQFNKHISVLPTAKSFANTPSLCCCELSGTSEWLHAEQFGNCKNCWKGPFDATRHEKMQIMRYTQSFFNWATLK